MTFYKDSLDEKASSMRGTEYSKSDHTAHVHIQKQDGRFAAKKTIFASWMYNWIQHHCSALLPDVSSGHSPYLHLHNKCEARLLVIKPLITKTRMIYAGLKHLSPWCLTLPPVSSLVLTECKNVDIPPICGLQ